MTTPTAQAEKRTQGVGAHLQARKRTSSKLCCRVDLGLLTSRTVR